MRQILIISLIVISVFVIQNLYQCFREKEGLLPNANEGENASSTPPPNPKQYQTYDKESNDPTFLALKNSANIEYIYQQMQSIMKVKENIDKMQQDINKNAAALKEIGNELQKGSNQLVGVAPGDEPEIPAATGLSTAPP